MDNCSKMFIMTQLLLSLSVVVHQQSSAVLMDE